MLFKNNTNFSLTNLNLSDIYCNAHGSINTTNNISYICDCDIAYFGFDCATAGITNWLGGWKAFQGIFASLYGILFCMVMKTFITNIQQV